MNSDIIDGLNDDQIMSLYEDTIVDGVHTVYCTCRTTSGNDIKWGNKEHGSCGLLADRIPDTAHCKTWCEYHNQRYDGLYLHCWCRSLGSSVRAYGSTYERLFEKCPNG